MQPFETSQLHLIAILEQILKRLNKTSKNLHLESLFSLFPPKIDVTSEPLGAAF
jgi:hypothetical protein